MTCAPAHFTGKERDAETGLDYFGARYLSSAQGRWMSPDPTRMTWERLDDPQHFNLYGYVRNNPFAYVDDFGEELAAVAFKNNSGTYSIGFLDTEVAPSFEAFNGGLMSEGGNPTFTYLFRTTESNTSVSAHCSCYFHSRPD